jgi:plastocyanin
VPAGGPNYDGTTFTNSGLLAVPDQTFSLNFTSTGDFSFECLVHANMSGVMHVRPAGTPYPHTQAFYNSQAKTDAARLIARGRELAGMARDGVEDTHGVVAGTGQLFATSSVADLRFYPNRKVIHLGQTATWTNQDPETPHTVTFGTELPGGPLGAFLPAGTDGPDHGTIDSTSQSVHSGFIGAGLPFGTQCAATFTKPGVYSYFCSLHDDAGMTGQIVVLPADD